MDSIACFDRENNPLEVVLSRLDKVKRVHNGYIARCPAHEDCNPSLSVTEGSDGRVLLKCFAGCSTEDIVKALSLTMADLFPHEERPLRKPYKQNQKPTYVYTDTEGKPLFGIIRTPEKQFMAVRPDGKGGWAYGMGKVNPTLYNLPRVIEAVSKGELVFVVEGEKDADNMAKVGLTATTNPFGAEKWKPEYADYLVRADVVIIPDNDEVGRRHAEQVARSLMGKAKIRLLELPSLPPKGDVSDWLEAGGTKEELLSMAEQAPLYEPKEALPEEALNDGLPTIDASVKSLPEVSGQAISALMMANEAEPRLFLHAGPVKIEEDEHGGLITVELDVDRMRYEMARTANWVAMTKDGLKKSKPPLDVVRDVLVSPLKFPVLENIVRVPIFAKDGTLQVEAGYHEKTRSYYAPPDRLSIPEVPKNPTKADVAEAKRWIFDELLCDFPFSSDADRAHAIALLLLPFCRAMIDGLTPLHFIEASGQGSGKGLLAKVLLSISCDSNVGIIPPPRDDEEVRKAITARLIEGRSAVLIDNITRLDSPVLSAALTADIWDDRLLGKNKTVRLPISWIWAATGNNAIVSTDIARRSIRIRLTPQEEKPWLRHNFKHKNLIAWTKSRRSRLIWSALTLIQSWISAGRPEADITPLGSFEDWTRVMGGILKHAEIPGFLGNIVEFYDTADTESGIWREFVNEWWEVWEDKKVKISDLFQIAEKIDGFDLGKGATERAQKTALGMKLKKMRDRIFDDKKICTAGTYDNAMLWKLVKKSQSAKG
jgi:hypothetical protein